MKLKQLLQQAFFILLFLFLVPQGFAQTIINPGDDFNAIINAALGGDIIEFNPGVYNGSISLSNKNFSSGKPLIIRSANGLGTVTISKGDYSGSPLDIVNSSYIAVDGIAFTGGLRGSYPTNSNHLIIINCEFSDSGQEGIHLNKSCLYVDIINCKIHDTGKVQAKWGEGIYIGAGSSYGFPDSSEYVWIEGNEIYDCGYGEGINVKAECFHVTIKDNKVYDIAPGTNDQYNLAAIAIEGASLSISNNYRVTEPRDVWVEDNEVYNVSGGYNVGRTANNGIMAGGSGVYIINNDIYNCDDRGLYGNAYADLGLALRMFNNNSYNNGTNLYANGALIDYSKADPGVNPNAKQTWYDMTLSVENTVEDLQFAAYPNPFKNQVKITYHLKEKSKVSLRIYDVQGRLVSELVNQEQNNGLHEVVWPAENAVSNGLYTYKLMIEADRGVYSKSGKLIAN